MYVKEKTLRMQRYKQIADQKMAQSVPHIKCVSCIKAQKIDPRCKYYNTRARSTAESKPFTFGDKIFRACIEYS